MTGGIGAAAGGVRDDRGQAGEGAGCTRASTLIAMIETREGFRRDRNKDQGVEDVKMSRDARSGSQDGVSSERQMNWEDWQRGTRQGDAAAPVPVWPMLLPLFPRLRAGLGRVRSRRQGEASQGKAAPLP